ncbi:MAG TPA: hypothetical protein VFX25_36255 [Streptosporangiaceae bacterium]|nr:hypothetical protein [Streptosporangiaceae bacterium]
MARSGIDAYATFPQAWQRVLLASLVFLDPVVVVLVALVRQAGIALAGAVMAADLAANLTGNWAGIQRDPAGLLLSAGLLGIGLFGLFVLVTVVPLLRTGDAARPRQLTAAMVMISGASGRNGLRSQRP